MTVIKGNMGGHGGPPTMDNIDLTHAKTLECEECGCKGFKQTLMLKRLSALISPSGKETLLPIQAFACEKCSHINKEFEEAELG